MTTVAISQPMYFPWPGFMEMMKLADVFLWLDDAQFSKGSFTNRIQLKMPGGRKWMSVPLKGKGAFTPIRDLEATDEAWRQSHRSMLRASLGAAPHLDDALAVFDAALGRPALCDVLIASAEEQARALGCLPSRIERSSAMDVPGGSWQRVIELVRAAGGTRYVSGAGGARYLDHAAFERAGLQVAYMEYNPLPWPQAHGAFTPYVTALDLVAARGPEAGSHLRPLTVPWRERLAAIEAGEDRAGGAQPGMEQDRASE